MVSHENSHPRRHAFWLRNPGKTMLGCPWEVHFLTTLVLREASIKGLFSWRCETCSQWKYYGRCQIGACRHWNSRFRRGQTTDPSVNLGEIRKNKILFVAIFCWGNSCGRMSYRRRRGNTTSGLVYAERPDLNAPHTAAPQHAENFVVIFALKTTHLFWSQWL